MNYELLRTNINTLWGWCLVSELKRWQIDRVFVSPGNRNAPVIASLAAEPSIKKIVCMDERAAAYQALGYAKATGHPGVLLCTSGSAACNYYPAIAEAFQEQVPLFVISADRPFPLVRSGANQVMEQDHLFGSFVKKSLSLPAASLEVSAATLLEHVAMMLNVATSYPHGPVHLNVPFTEPLGPSPQKSLPAEYVKHTENALLKRASVPVRTAQLTPTLDGRAWEYVQSCVAEAQRGLLLVGRLNHADDRAAVLSLANKLGWPVYFDVTSGILNKEHPLTVLDPETPAVYQALTSYAPDCVLQIGRRLVTKWFDDLRRAQPPKHVFVVNELTDTQDPEHQRDLPLIMREGAFASQCAPRKNTQDMAAMEQLLAVMKTTREKMQSLVADAPFCFPTIANQILATLPKDHILFCGNSSTIRYFDTWGVTDRGCDLEVIANRGLSGIEGQVATVIGYAEAAQKPATIVLGDVSLIHDLNSLLLLKQTTQHITVVVVNNREGTIFRKLPVAVYPEVMDPLMLTPHQFSFEGIAAMAGLRYECVTDKEAFKDVLITNYKTPTATLIECVIDPQRDELLSRAL